MGAPDLRIRQRKTLNIPLLKRVEKRLRRLRHEEHFNQGVWIRETSCGTAACIAGFVVLEAKKELGLKLTPPDTFYGDREIQTKTYENIQTVAQKVLGLSYPRQYRLFSGGPSDYWPAPFAARWYEAESGRSQERPSRIAADLLAEVIKTKGEVLDH